MGIQMAESPPDTTRVGEAVAARRLRFRQSLQDIAGRATGDDLVRWMLVPASIIVILGFNFMIWGWVGAARTAREIEQIPYLISGGIIGLALVFVGGLLLAATFWVAVTRKFEQEGEARTREQLQIVSDRLAQLETTLDDVNRNGGRTRPAKKARKRSKAAAPRSRA